MGASSLRDNAQIVMGQSPPGETCNTVGIGLPLLNGPTEFGPHHPLPVQFTTDARKRAKQGDVLFCVRGSTTGRMNWADREYAIGRGVAAIRHKKKPELQPFVRAVIEYRLPGLLAQATGSTFPNVSADQLAGLWCPSLEEDQQRAIAHILGTLDDKIELNRRMNETLEAIARALFKSWFVDFDPVRAKHALSKVEGAEGRDPGLPLPLADLFSDSFEDSELGEIPKGWRVGALETCCSNALNAARRRQKPSRYRMCPSIAFHRDHYSWPTASQGLRLKAASRASTKATFCSEPCVPISTRYGIAPFDGTTRTTAFVLLPARDEDFAFATLLMHDPETIDYATRHSTGSTIPYAVWGNSLENMPIVFPAADTRTAFGRLMRPLLDRIPERYFESRALTALRDMLLPKLISGELRLKDAERFIGDRE